MKKTIKTFAIMIIAIMVSAKVFAYDFKVGGIYYKINTEEELAVSVTYMNYVGPANTTAYSGDVVIPSTVTHNEITYNVTSIDECAFRNCYDLVSVVIPNSVISIGEYAFYYCTGLTSITFNNNITEIKDWTFSGCTSLTSMVIPESVTSIGNYAFSNCNNLVSVTVPQNVTSIGSYAFGNTALNTFYCLAEEPPTITGLTFYAVPRNQVTIYVPCGRVNAYSQAEYWSEFESIHEWCSGLENTLQDNSIFIYPNPAIGNITISANEDIFIFNSLGQIVKQITNPRGETIVSVADLPQGIYYLRVGEKQQRLIKE